MYMLGDDSQGHIFRLTLSFDYLAGKCARRSLSFSLGVLALIGQEHHSALETAHLGSSKGHIRPPKGIPRPRCAVSFNSCRGGNLLYQQSLKQLLSVHV